MIARVCTTFVLCGVICIAAIPFADAPAYAQTFRAPRSRQKWTARYNREETDDLGLWPQSMFNYRHGKWLFELDVNPRLQYRINRLNEFHLRTFVGYQVKPWMTMWIGAYPWAPLLEPTYVSETRLLQQVGLEKAIGRFAFSLRSRVEQRWIEHTQDRTSWRIREMPRVNYFIDRKKSLYLFTADELFVNLNTISPAIKRGIGQNRLYVGTGIKLNDHANLEVSYLNQWLNRRPAGLPNRFNHNIVINLITNF